MRIFKKMCFVLLISFSIGFLGCIDCNCEPYSNKLVTILDVSNAIHLDINGIETNIESNLRYRGLRINYDIKELAYNPPNKYSFSLFPSAYAWSCHCDYPTVYFKDTYPSEIKITTLYDLNSENSSGSIVNKYFEMPILTSNTEQTKFDSLDVVNRVFVRTKDVFLLDFILIDRNALQNDSLQFRIETILNTGDTLVAQTPLIIFE